MKISIFFPLLFLLFTSCKNDQKHIKKEKSIEFAIVLHGGAGAIDKKYLSKEKEQAYKKALSIALEKGYSILEKGGTAINAVQETIMVLEDSPLFNAGKGAVFDSEGKNRMDASIMDGNTLNAGAVAGVSNVKNPIKLASLVMRKSKHVILSGRGAEIFGEQNGIEFKPDTYFYTKRNFNYLMKVQKQERENFSKSLKPKKYGTVGVVALDKSGNLAAGTSTGGLTNKKYGRIGDSPIIGAGTYADNNSCAVSCTGVGEYYIRTVAAKEIASLKKYKKYTVQQALDSVLFNQIEKLGGEGGMIVMDTIGNIAWNFNTKGMFRAFKKSSGEKKIRFYELDSISKL